MSVLDSGVWVRATAPPATGVVHVRAGAEFGAGGAPAPTLWGRPTRLKEGPMLARMLGAFLVLVGTLAGSAPAQQQMIDLPAAADNTLYYEPTGSISNGRGTHMFSGKTDNGFARRAVVRFDLSIIPQGSTINAVTLTLNQSRTRAGTQTMTLHRVNASWGEGVSVAGGGEGGGAPSELNDPPNSTTPPGSTASSPARSGPRPGATSARRRRRPPPWATTTGRTPGRRRRWRRRWRRGWRTRGRTSAGSSRATSRPPAPPSVSTRARTPTPRCARASPSSTRRPRARSAPAACRAAPASPPPRPSAPGRAAPSRASALRARPTPARARRHGCSPPPRTTPSTRRSTGHSPTAAARASSSGPTPTDGLHRRDRRRRRDPQGRPRL
ncbi:MAG: DNRLRE domain-containing protein [Phycisphaerae bacterium]|nr:DNRLRE domain-containing protein [Phycisphaerae bacterium]